MPMAFRLEYYKEYTRGRQSFFGDESELDSETGSIRVGGRIHKSRLAEGTKYPVILPNQNRFVDFIIQEAHEKQLHAGANQNPHAYKYDMGIESFKE